jgi:2-keto-4-pentenoate hydratase
MAPADVDGAVAALLEARRTRRWLSALPQGCRPGDLTEAYAIQDRVTRELGPVVAWKVGAGSPEAAPSRAPITASTLLKDGDRLPAAALNHIGVEVEIAYRFARDLPARPQPYTREEVLAAIGSAHPAIEIADSRYAVWASQDRLSHVADQLNHGALIIGPGRTDWANVDPARQKVRLTLNGKLATEVVGGNPVGDLFRLLHWLANDGARSLGGLKAGCFVTTGSCTGVNFVKAPVEVLAELPGLGRVTVGVDGAPAG